MIRLSLGLVTFAVAIFAAGGNALAQSGPEFQRGFKVLGDQIPDVVGQPLENEHWGANGDSLQQTSKGLMVWRKADNWTAFTDGARTWINGPSGVQDRRNGDTFAWEAPPTVAKPAPPSQTISEPQGFSPFAIALTRDGKYGYLSFGLSEDIFKIRLEDLAVVAAADLSGYFPIACSLISLDATEKKLFAYTPTWRKLLVLDTETMKVVHTISDFSATGITRSRYGPYLLTWDGGNTVKLVNTESYEVTKVTDERTGFLKIRESSKDPGLWYVLTREPPQKYVAGLYDYRTKAWRQRVSFAQQGQGQGVFDLQVLPGEQKLYVATLGGWYPDYHAYGWLHSIDLAAGSERAIPVDGGALTLEASPDGRRLFVGTGWPVPNSNNLLVLDTRSDEVVGRVELGKTGAGWPFTQMNDLQIDPANPRLLYATSTDANAFAKVDLDSLAPTGVKVLNQGSLAPRFFTRRPDGTDGYVLVAQSARALQLDVGGGTVAGTVEFPLIRPPGASYSVAAGDDGRLLISQGESVLEVDGQDMRLLKTNRLPPGIPSVWDFILSGDGKRIYSIGQERGESGYRPDTFLAISTRDYRVEGSLKLDGGSFEQKPFELPDGSKLYALGGQPNGAVVVQVIEAESLSLKKTITFDRPGLLGISAGPDYPYAYDARTRTLFVGATQVVLAIDTDTDEITKVIYLGDAAKAIGLDPGQLTYLNAVGLVYNPNENYLYIAHLDRSFVSIYDLRGDRYLPKAIPLKGYFPRYFFANDDYSKIYSLNSRSDSVSVIDTRAKSVEKVLDLHLYLDQ